MQQETLPYHRYQNWHLEIKSFIILKMSVCSSFHKECVLFCKINSAGIDFGTTQTLVSLQSCLGYAFLLFGITPLHPSLQAAIASIVPFW
jgi:hypothetical protein